MSYQDQLNPWVIHQLTSDVARSVVMRFRRRNEAESYLKAVSQLRPSAKFTLSFEAQAAKATTETEDEKGPLASTATAN